MSVSYCSQYGFDDLAIERRLRSMALSAADHPLCIVLHDQVIVPALDRLVEDFYAGLAEQPESVMVLDRVNNLAPLKITQREYLETLGIGFDRPEYFEHRLRVGLAHARFGISLGTYLCAYRLTQQLLLDAIPDTLRRDFDHYARLQSLIIKLTYLDMSLAAETYHVSKIKTMKRSLDNLKAEESHLRQLASLDSLTRLLNHESGMAALTAGMEQSRRNGRSLCLIMADLDKFKSINDTYGHPVGDSVLKESASRIKFSVRQHDVVCRYGGEEFMIILADTELTTAQAIAERIRSHLADSPVVVNGIPIHLTISIGLCPMGPSEDVKALLEKTDRALYLAKGQGRNRVETG